MPSPIKKIPSAAGKKRKQVVSKSANDGSGPPKKKYKYYCSADGCTNKVVQGGVCVRHGAKVKRCSSEGCTNRAQNGGVCKRHGAKLKRCSSEGCDAFVRLSGEVCSAHSEKGCHFEGCSIIGIYNGLCVSHRSRLTAPLAQASIQRGRIQEGDNPNDAATVIEISDNEEEEEKKQSPLAGPKRNADAGKQRAKTAAFNAGANLPNQFQHDIAGNEGVNKARLNGVSEQSSLGRVANLKDENEQGKSDTRPPKRA
eukprot:scaffold5299_cov73-Skeletonema_menzelii.AAC.1